MKKCDFSFKHLSHRLRLSDPHPVGHQREKGGCCAVAAGGLCRFRSHNPIGLKSIPLMLVVDINISFIGEIRRLALME
jgi:hypothetical protein